MAKRAKAKSAIPGTRSACQVMAHDLQRLAGVIADVSGAEGAPYVRNSATFGPAGKTRLIEVRPGGGSQKTFERRVIDLKTEKVVFDWSGVGNTYGLGRQLSRDIARLWGCKTLLPERGFEGAGPRKRKR